jgi:hypothetical protein
MYDIGLTSVWKNLVVSAIQPYWSAKSSGVTDFQVDGARHYLFTSVSK